MSRFTHCLHLVLGHEGGFSDIKADRGKRTNRGVTQKTYDAYRARQGLPYRDVRSITASESLDDLYYDYWRDAHCAALPEPLDYFVFDCAVNSGPARAIKLLQAALHTDPDGLWGPATQGALDRAVTDESVADLAEEYLRVRALWYAQIIADNPSQKIFEAGWSARLKKLRAVL